MNVANQTRPYEVNQGDTSRLVEHWQNELLDRFDKGEGMSRKQMKKILDEICVSFKQVPVQGEPKVRVGVVGEIYIKFSSLGNNQLEQFLLDEGAEPVVPGLTDFLVFKIYNRVSDVEMFGGNPLKHGLCKFFMGYVEKCQKDMIEALEKSGFRAPGTFSELHELVHGYLNDGCKMGEGWLLTAEMLELIHSGTPNIVCAQPFGCLPNHIVGKGMIRVLKDDYPDSNIVAIDYDPGATKINQENRIKLMLANAKRQAQASAPQAKEEAVPTAQQ
jgi:predicted nucleotide-binding protein (sugar kinase/HSP70/actin superfamily)